MTYAAITLPTAWVMLSIASSSTYRSRSSSLPYCLR
jgi:hypothetical protein